MKEKDALYYHDLILYIKSCADIIEIEDDEVKERIKERQEDIPHLDEKGFWCELTEFNKDLFEFTLNISRKCNVVLQGPSDLANYPEETEALLKTYFIKIAQDYSETPGSRYIEDGSYSGEDFRDNYLEQRYLECLQAERKLVIDFDGGYGYNAGFLEEVFGGLIRKGYRALDLINNIVFISEDEPQIIEDIMIFMLEEDQRRFPRERKIQD